VSNGKPINIDDPNASNPMTIKEAMNSKYAAQWLAGIYEETASLLGLNVYEEVDYLPPGAHIVDSKWVLHIKQDVNGHIV
jgi:hypothetical protein